MGATVTARKFEGGYISLDCPILGAVDWSVAFTAQYTAGYVLIQSGFNAIVSTPGIIGCSYWLPTGDFATRLNASIPDSNLHSYIYTCSGTTGARCLYTDGILSASDNSGTALGNLDNGKIGANRDVNVTGLTNGFLTELMFFTKTLSASEVRALVGNTSPDTTGMAGRYKFNEAVGVNTASPTVGSVSGTYVGTWNAPQSIVLPDQLITPFIPQPIIFF